MYVIYTKRDLKILLASELTKCREHKQSEDRWQQFQSHLSTITNEKVHSEIDFSSFDDVIYKLIGKALY